MKRVLPLVFGLLALAAASAQDRIAVTFKVFPSDYEVFSGGDRLAYTPRGDFLRTYLLPPGPARVSLTSPSSLPVSLTVDVKAGALVQAKLDPRQGPLSLAGEAATGKLPRAVAFSSDGRRLLVALQGEPAVEAFEVPSLKKAGRFSPSDGSSGGFTGLLTQGASVWAVQRDGRAYKIDPQTLTAGPAVALPFSGNAALTDLGGTVGVVNWDYAQLALLDPAAGKASVAASFGGSLRGFAFAGGTAYAVLFDTGKIVVSDASSWKPKATWTAGKAPRPVAVLGGSVFVGDMGGAQVLVLGANGAVTRTVAVPSNPHEMAASSAAGLVAVASRGRNNPDDYQLPGPDFGRVTLLDVQGTVAGSVWGRNQPTGLAFSADGKYLAFTDFLDQNVELYRVTAGR